MHALQGANPYRWFGLGRYTRELALHLVKEHRNVIAGLEIDRELPVPGAIDDFAGLGLLRQWPYDVRPLMREDGVRIFHVLSPFSPFPVERLFPPALSRIGALLVVTLHDLIPYVESDTYLAEPQVRGWYHARLNLVRQADGVIAVSQSAKDDAVRLLGVDPDRVRVTYEGASPIFQPPGSRESVLAGLRARFPELREGFVLYAAGAADPRKNVEGLIRAFGLIPASIRGGRTLVVTGGTPAVRQHELMTVAQEAGVGDSVVFPGFVDDELLRDLYQACDLSVFPSLYEGFGLPALEAMCCGAPVVVSDRTSLPEIVDFAEARFDPASPADIARVMSAPLSDEQTNHRLREKGLRRSRDFSWSKAAAATAEAYESLARSRSRSPRLTRPSIAVCGSISEADGLSRIALDLAERQGVHVDLVADSPSGAANEVMTLNAVQFRWKARWGYYDAVLYVIGARPEDGLLLEAMREHRGVVWLRSVYLAPLYRWYYEQKWGRDVARLPKELRRWTQRYPDPENGLLLRDEETQHRDSICMTAEVASRAMTIIVGSDAEREIVEVDSGSVSPVLVVPRESWDKDVGIEAVLRIVVRSAAR
jgi:glycosyltransferase involved in cell wall biosynthesis